MCYLDMGFKGELDISVMLHNQKCYHTHKLFAIDFFPNWRNSVQIAAGADLGGSGAQAPRPTKMAPQHQNSTKLRPQNGSFRP